MPAAGDDDGAIASLEGRFTETGLDEPLVRGSVNPERSSVESQRRSSQLDRRSSRLSAHDRASRVGLGADRSAVRALLRYLCVDERCTAVCRV